MTTSLFRTTLVFFACCWTSLAAAQVSATYCDELTRLSRLLEATHFQPRVRDSAFSQSVMREWLAALDPSRLYFTERDVSELAARGGNLHREIGKGACGLLETTLRTYLLRLAATDSLLAALEGESWLYRDTDHMRLAMEGYDAWAPEARAWQSRWRDFLKYQVLLTVTEPDTEPDDAAFPEREPELRNNLIRRARCRIDRLRNHPMGFFDYGAMLFLQAYALIQDPHTSYFSPFEMTAFEASMSREAYAFGFELEESANGELEISYLVPGSPAWKSNELTRGDILLEIQLSDGTAEALVCVGPVEVAELLRSPAAQRARFVVRKKSGQVRMVSLVKEKIAVEENAVNSLLLKGDRPLGYIYLPAFYTEWENDDALGCANDVAKELVQLQADGIEGLILDLRFNGGGSMDEALNLAGIFIDAGPLCILKDREGATRTLKDPHRGSLYDGPLVILINGFSASASELLAAVLQDYHRAVIVGSRSYGKATGQIILPLQDNPRWQPDEAGGFAKVTVEKFYRVTGHSHQRRGVLPDIVLPDLYERLWPAEADDPYALPADSVNARVSIRPLPAPPLAQLMARSVSRLAAHERFDRIRQINQALRPLFEEGIDVRLEPAAFAADVSSSYELMAALDTVEQQAVSAYEVAVPRLYQPVLEMDAHRKEMNDSLMRRIGQDVYLEEAYRVLNDWISLKK